MKFDPELTETFTTEGSTFEYNHARSEYLSQQIVDQYDEQLKTMAVKYKKAKKKGKSHVKHGLNILALHSEWNVPNNDETLYLIFNHEEGCFTDVTTDNEYYSNPIEEGE